MYAHAAEKSTANLSKAGGSDSQRNQAVEVFREVRRRERLLEPVERNVEGFLERIRARQHARLDSDFGFWRDGNVNNAPGIDPAAVPVFAGLRFALERCPVPAWGAGGGASSSEGRGGRFSVLAPGLHRGSKGIGEAAESFLPFETPGGSRNPLADLPGRLPHVRAPARERMATSQSLRGWAAPRALDPNSTTASIPGLVSTAAAAARRRRSSVVGFIFPPV